MKIKFKSKILILFSLIILFSIGVVLLQDFFSQYLTGIRGGLIFIFLAVALILISMSVPPQMQQYNLPLFYFVAMAGGYFYQALLLYDAPLRASFFRSVFYLLLMIGMLLFLLNKKIDLKYIYFFCAWLFFNSFSLLGDKVPDDVLMYFLLGIVLPGFFVLVLHVFFKTGGYFEHLTRAVSTATLGVLGGMLLIMLLAIFLKFGDIKLTRNAANLNYGAGLLFLGWPFITWRLNSRSFPARILIVLIVISTALFSFSRPTMVITFTLLIFTFFISFKSNKKAILSLLLAFVVFTIFIPKEPLEYWLDRLNIEKWSDIFNPERWKDIFQTDRQTIWADAYQSFTQRPLTGHGLASFSTLMHEKTAGVVEYSEAHSLILTVLAERGLLGFIIVAWIILYILFKSLLRWRTESGAQREFFFLSFISFFCFLLFAHTTGAEMVRSGTLYIDGTVSAYMMVYLIIALSWKQIREKSFLDE